jgi:hypothetical protein
VNGITSFDSAKISQHVVHLITLNSTQQTAADVSGNGTITSFDSALVSQYVVHIPNTSSTGTWKFVPPNRSYTDVEMDHAGEDYGAVLMGEVTGNWTPTAPNQLFAIAETKVVDAASIGVTAPTTSVPVSSNFTIPLEVQDTTGQGIISYQYILNFDKNVIVPQTNPCDLTGSISSSLTATCNPATPGVLEVSVFGTMPINGSGVLMNLKFTAVGAQGTVSPLTVNSFMFNEGIPQNSITNGQVTVQIVTAAQASVSGMVLRQNGVGVRNARVSLTDANGNARTVRTNQFGFYRIDGLTVGETYVVDVSAKGLTFETQTLTVMSNMNSVNLIGQH